MNTNEPHNPYVMAAFAGALYAMGMFAIGFAMGGVRLLLLVPMLGELLAVVIEVPIMLGFSWLLCGRAIQHWEVLPQLSIRVVMGVSAFGCLMIADTILGIFAFGNSFGELLARWGSAAGAIGLAGQVMFGLFPLVRLRASSA